MAENDLTNDLLQLEAIAALSGGKINISTVLLTIPATENKQLTEALEALEKEGIEVINSDVEPDEEENYEQRIQPFDPTKIQIRMMQLTIQLIVDRIEHEEIEFYSPFQRIPGLWTATQKSQLIESILLRIPLPAFYFDATDDNKWIIIDGLQRISVIKEFICDKPGMRLKGMEFFSDLDGQTFSELPRSLQRRLVECNINAYIVDPITPHTAKYNIFKRINTGGLVLTPQEIRNALYQGNATKLIKELSETKEFLTATCGSIPSSRMLDREYCLRFIAFNYLPLDDYAGVADDFLNLAMCHINLLNDDELIEIRKSFKRVMKDCFDIMGNHAFRRMAEDGYRRPINKTLFEAWTYCIFRAERNDIKYLKKNNEGLKEDYIELCNDSVFQNAIKGTDRKSLSMRIDMLGKILYNAVPRSEWV